jgi:hypothetical protein
VAWTGLALVAVPIVIHLLARHRTRRVPFPSLRFLPVVQVAALRRRAVADWPLLLVRIAIVTAAVAAASAPVFVSAARQRGWGQRIARAIVITHTSAALDALVAGEREGTLASHTVSAADSTLPDALREAGRWLRAQPPASREVVVAGDLRERSLAARDFDALEPHVGIRFLPAPEPDGPTQPLTAISETPTGDVGAFRVDVTPDARQTVAAYTAETSRPIPRVRVVAAPAQRSQAEAVLKAVLREGVIARTTAGRELTVVFAGGDLGAAERIVLQAPDIAPTDWTRALLERNPELSIHHSQREVVVRASMPVTDPRAADLVARILRAAYREPMDDEEPGRIDAARLARWSRPATGSPPDALPANEGDHRWLWAVALALLAVEHIVRKRMHHA